MREILFRGKRIDNDEVTDKWVYGGITSGIVEYFAEYSSVHWSDSISAFCAGNRLGAVYFLNILNKVEVVSNIHANPKLSEGE